ncbi:hypothetical protein ALP65_04561, partial [Pseudomonas aeruginosa]
RRWRRSGDAGEQLLGRHRPAEQEALQRIAAEAGQELLLGLGFHALGDDLQVQRAAEGDDRRDDRGVVAVVGQLVDEATVDLQFARRQALEIEQAGVAGAEVVDGDADAHRRQLLEDHQAGIGIAHGGRFGHLEDQVAGLQAVAQECVAHRVDQAGMGELQGRKVHRDVPLRMPAVQPEAHLPAGFVEHPLADLHDQAGLFRQRQELAGGDQPVLRMLPAQQRFHADHRSVRRQYLGLVVQDQLPALQGLAQVMEQLQLFLGVGVHRTLEEAVAVPSLVLGVIHRRVGIDHQFVAGLPVAGVERDADARRDPHLVAGYLVRLADPLHQFLGQGRGVGGLAGLDQQDELVAAEPGNHVLVAGRGAQPFGDGVEHRIAGGMAVLVVDRLE